MDNLLNVLKNNELNDVSLKEYINDFNLLSDSEIAILLANNNISNENKQMLVQTCTERINHLPIDLWSEAISYVTGSHIFLKYYSTKINNMSYTDLVNFIYNNYCDADCLAAILNMDGFKKILSKKKKMEKYNFKYLIYRLKPIHMIKIFTS